MYFDKWNCIPLKEALSESLIEQYKTHYRKNEKLRVLLEWFDSQADISDEAALTTWRGELPVNDSDLPIDEKLSTRWTCQKAKMRGLMRMHAYMQRDHSINFSGDEATVTISNES